MFCGLSVSVKLACATQKKKTMETWQIDERGLPLTVSAGRIDDGPIQLNSRQRNLSIINKSHKWTCSEHDKYRTFAIVDNIFQITNITSSSSCRQMIDR